MDQEVRSERLNEYKAYVMPNCTTLRTQKYFQFLNLISIDFMSKDKSSRMFNLKLLVMKKMRFLLFVLITSVFVVTISYGQNSLNDSLKSDLKLSNEVLKKLDSKDIVEILKFKEKLQNDKEVAAKYAVDPSKFIHNFIPIMPIILFTFILMILFIPFFFNYKKTKGRQLIINNLIEKGQEIPKELLLPQVKTSRSDFHNGIILISFGLSISIVLLSIKIPVNIHFWTLGLIPLFIGIGYLVSFQLDKTSKNKSEKE
jgi:hypothetical protein